MYDPYVTRELTVRDLLVHRSGLGLGAGRPALVAGIDLQPGGDRPAAPLHQAGDVVPQRLRLRQRPLPRRRRGHRGGHRPVVGRFRRRAHPEKGRHDGEQRPPLGGGRGRQRRDAARPGRGRRAAHRAVHERQHQPGRRHQLRRRGHGQVDARPARPGQARRRDGALLGADGPRSSKRR